MFYLLIILISFSFSSDIWFKPGKHGSLFELKDKNGSLTELKNKTGSLTELKDKNDELIAKRNRKIENFANKRQELEERNLQNITLQNELDNFNISKRKA